MAFDWFQVAGIIAIVILVLVAILMGKRIGVFSAALRGYEGRVRYLEARERRLHDIETRAWKELKQLPGIFKRITGH